MIWNTMKVTAMGISGLLLIVAIVSIFVAFFGGIGGLTQFIVFEEAMILIIGAYVVEIHVRRRKRER